jgi:hypothetical protein
METNDEPPDGGGRSTTDDQCKKPTKRPSTSIPATEPRHKMSSSPSASVQNIYTRPEFASDKLKYSDNDSAPFIVHVSRIEPDPASGLSIRLLQFAQLIHKNSVLGIVKGGIKASGRNKVTVEFKNAVLANKFLESSILEKHGYVASIPKFHITRNGIVRNIPSEWSMEELANSIECPDNIEVIRARRLNRKSIKEGSIEWIPTRTVVLTFQGQKLPERVYCFHTSLPVSVYQLPTIQCNACCRFGHIQAQCRSKPRCYRCSQPHLGETCTVSPDNSTCLFCSGPHFASSFSCPEHTRQKLIKSVMSEENISYSEASLRFRPVRRSYADTSRMPSTHTHNQLPLNAPSPSIHQNTVLPPPKSLSYNKTVYINRRHSSPIGNGYDKTAHEQIINIPPSSQPNGCALSTSNDIISANEDLSCLLVKVIINFLSKFNDTLPSNVSDTLNQLISFLPQLNGSYNPSVELPKH